MKHSCRQGHNHEVNFTHVLLEEGAAVVIEDRWEALAMRGRSQAVVQSQRNGAQFVPELILLLVVEQVEKMSR